MIGAEILALVALLVAGGIGAKSIASAWALAQRQRVRKETESDQMRQDLRNALQSHDYRKLDDFIVLWGDHVDKPTLAHVKARRDDLYIDDSERKETRS